MQPRIVTCILCYNGVADTLACLRPLEQLDYTRDQLRILVLDNASNDGTPGVVRTAFSAVVVIENGANLGYAAGNNVGLRYALQHGMEAHAAGRPVLTWALGGMAELVRDEVDGLHFQPGDAEDLARQIERLRGEPGLLGRLASGVAPPATIDAEMAVMLRIYESALQREVASAATP
jgi:glycosyltransferase involved in cell wall biosynthesis